MNRVLEIERNSFLEPYDRFIFNQLLTIEPGAFLVAEDSTGSVLGYVTAVSSGPEAMIYSIAVNDGNRRRGIGRALMSAELDHLSKIKAVSRVTLQVSVNNSAAQALYEKFSFVQTGKIKRYYPNGDDAWVMSLELPRSS